MYAPEYKIATYYLQDHGTYCGALGAAAIIIRDWKAGALKDGESNTIYQDDFLVATS